MVVLHHQQNYSLAAVTDQCLNRLALDSFAGLITAFRLWWTGTDGPFVRSVIRFSTVTTSIMICLKRSKRQRAILHKSRRRKPLLRGVTANHGEQLGKLTPFPVEVIYMQTDDEDNLAELTVSTRDPILAGPCRPHVEDYRRPPMPNLLKIIGGN